MLRNILTCALVITFSLFFTIKATYASESLRTQEINECRDDEIVTWGDGRDRPATSSLLEFTYNPKGSPEWFSAYQVLTMVTKASESWSQCGVRTQMIPWNSVLEKQDLIIVVKWDEKESGGNIGLANLTRRTLALSPGVFRLLKSRNPKHDARETLQMVISHEIGHFFGLMAHSKLVFNSLDQSWMLLSTPNRLIAPCSLQDVAPWPK